MCQTSLNLKSPVFVNKELRRYIFRTVRAAMWSLDCFHLESARIGCYRAASAARELSRDEPIFMVSAMLDRS
jgi:hypothetical protein